MPARFSNALRRFTGNDSGAANTEYVIIMALLIVAAIAIVAQVGPRVLSRWSALDEKLGDGDASTVVVNHPAAARR